MKKIVIILCIVFVLCILLLVMPSAAANVTVVAAGDQSYYLGEEIKLSGNNTESSTTYLFIIGPNLPTNGGVLTEPKTKVIPDPDPLLPDLWNSVKASVLANNTWSYKWGTSNLDLDVGIYTIYAVSKPYDNDPTLLAQAAYSADSIIIKKPIVSATVSPSTVAQGHNIFINGTAEGQPDSVAIWIMGKNFAIKNTETVNVDGSFSYELKQETTKSMYSGQYFVVVQHPGVNGIYDIDWTGAPAQYVYDYGGTTPVSLFKILGPGSLQGSDAAEALIQGINQPYIDDIFTELQFQIVSLSKIGVYKDGAWYLDYLGEGMWTANTKAYGFGATGFTPVIGDWNGDGATKIGVYKDGAWYLDYLGEGHWSANTKVYSFGASGFTPVVGDWNGDGRTKIGVYKDGAWYLDYLGNGTWTSNTKVYSFGAPGFTPLIGKWS